MANRNEILYAIDLCDRLLESDFVYDDDYADVIDIKEVLENLL